MSDRHDILLKHGTVIDPANAQEGLTAQTAVRRCHS